LRNDRYFEINSFYSKIDIPVSSDLKLGLTMGYSNPRIRFGDFPSSVVPFKSKGIVRAFFTTASLGAALSRGLDFEASFYTFRQKFVQTDEILNDALVMGFPVSAGDLFENLAYDEKTTGGSSKIIWTRGMHTAVLGADISTGHLDQTIDYGQIYQIFGKPETIRTNPRIHKWAVFVNDTITTGKFSITPGIRYDRNNVTGSFTSPSLGATYRLGEHTILKTSVARGFTIPPLSFTSGGGLFLDPNPSLKPEKVWSYQAGVESGMTDYLWMKATVFRHDLNDALEQFAETPSSNAVYLNNGKIKRQGIEFNAETVPLYDISLNAGFTYVRIKPSSGSDTANKYAYNLTIKYDDRKSFMAQLFGYYIWWDLDRSAMAKYDTFIWDLNLHKKIYSTEKTNTEIFLTAHNIFNGSHYAYGDTKNPGRWLEAGLRFKF
jgi:vitamin B12 transporter